MAGEGRRVVESPCRRGRRPSCAARTPARFAALGSALLRLPQLSPPPPFALPFPSFSPPPPAAAAAAARPRQFRPTGLPSPALSPRCPGPERRAAAQVGAPKRGSHQLAQCPRGRAPRSKWGDLRGAVDLRTAAHCARSLRQRGRWRCVV